MSAVFAFARLIVIFAMADILWYATYGTHLVLIGVVVTVGIAVATGPVVIALPLMGQAKRSAQDSGGQKQV